MIRNRAFPLLLLTITLLAGAPALAQDWEFAVAPYLWLPSIDGTMKYSLPPGSGDGSMGVELSADNVGMFFMVAGEARRERLVVTADFLYLELGGELSNVREVDFGSGPIDVGASINTATQTSLDGASLTLTGGYAIRHSPDGSTVDVIGGVRYLGLETDTDWQLSVPIESQGRILAANGSTSRKVDLWDGIIGVRGRGRLGENWHVPFHLDIGAGSSTLTWQAAVGVTRSFGWGAIGAAWRELGYDQDDEDLIQDFSFSGPGLTATFRF
jgi:hypothetical protein